jgi:hypothetical protein
MTPAYRITDRTGLVHVVVSHTAQRAEAACGKTLTVGRGGEGRVWQAVLKHQHNICSDCKLASEGHR